MVACSVQTHLGLCGRENDTMPHLRTAVVAGAMLACTSLITPAASAMPIAAIASNHLDGSYTVAWVCGPYRCWWRPNYWGGYHRWWGPRRW
jgi:hypothetical protein